PVPGESQPSEPGADTPVEFVKAQIAESMKEDPLLTKILVAVGIWEAVLAAAMLLGSFMMLFWSGLPLLTWLLVWVPVSGFMEFCVYSILKRKRGYLLWLQVAALFAGGASWTYLFVALGRMPTNPVAGGILFVFSFLNVLACAGIIWHFGRNQLRQSVVKTEEEENQEDS
ncbi:unnamed protein product, partial [marine sediment metagenome]